MDAQALLSSFNADQIAALKAALEGVTDVSGRSPLRPRQLHDLRLTPAPDDPRPTFFWSAVSPRNAVDLTRTAPYPRLMWEPKTGKEITVTDAAGQASYTAQGFVLTPPANAETPDPAEVLKEQLEGLSEADRQLVLKGAHQTRLERMQAALLDMSDEERAALVAALTAVPEKARKAS